MNALLLASALLLSSLSAQAAKLGKCDGLDNIANLSSMHRLPDGNRLASVTRGYDETNTSHLLVISYGDDDFSSCVSINSDLNPNGFADIKLAKLKMIVNAPGDMTIAVPVDTTDEKSGKITTEIVKFRIVEKFPSATVTLR